MDAHLARSRVMLLATSHRITSHHVKRGPRHTGARFSTLSRHIHSRVAPARPPNHTRPHRATTSPLKPTVRRRNTCAGRPLARSQHQGRLGGVRNVKPLKLARLVHAPRKLVAQVLDVLELAAAAAGSSMGNRAQWVLSASAQVQRTRTVATERRAAGCAATPHTAPHTHTNPSWQRRQRTHSNCLRDSMSMRPLRTMLGSWK
jgi:hypothetical protein